jgi:hypothetical protein
MALIDATDMTTLTTTMGEGDKALLSQTVNSGGTAMAKANTLRDQVRSGATDSDYDAADVLESAMRSTERTTESNMKAVFVSAANALDTYMLSITSKKLKAYYDGLTTETTVAFTDDFRSLWRRVKNEELGVSLGYLEKTASGGTAWTAYSADKTIQVASSLELRTGSSAPIGGTEIIVNLTVKTSATATPELIVKTIPAGSAAKTQFPIIGNGRKFNTIVSMVVSGGEANDRVELWVAPTG